MHQLQQEACKIRHFPPVQRCVSSNVTGVIRFHLEAVVDNQDSATFIVSDREITKLIEKEVTSLALEEVGFNSTISFRWVLKLFLWP